MRRTDERGRLFKQAYKEDKRVSITDKTMYDGWSSFRGTNNPWVSSGR